MNSCSSSQMSSSWNICHIKQSGRGNFSPVLESHPLFDILQSLVSLRASWKRKAEIQSWTDKLQMFERTTLWSILKITQTSVNFSVLNFSTPSEASWYVNIRNFHGYQKGGALSSAFMNYPRRLIIRFICFIVKSLQYTGTCDVWNEEYTSYLSLQCKLVNRVLQYLSQIVHSSHLCSHSNVPLSFSNVEQRVF